MKKTLLAIACGAAFTTLSTGALASVTSASYSFTSCLSGDCGSVGSTVQSVATLTMTSITNGVSFALTSTSAVAGSFISALYFNGPSGQITWNAGQVYKDIDWATKSNGSATSQNGYNWDITYPTGANKDRLLNGDTASWTITGTGLSLQSFALTGNGMMVHVEGLANGGSEKIGAVAAVPEPESYAMLLAGLGIVGAIARRRSKA